MPEMFRPVGRRARQKLAENLRPPFAIIFNWHPRVLLADAALVRIEFVARPAQYGEIDVRQIEPFGTERGRLVPRVEDQFAHRVDERLQRAQPPQTPLRE